MARGCYGILYVITSEHPGLDNYISHCPGQRMIIHQVAVYIITSLHYDLLPMAMAAMSLLLAVWSAIAPGVFYRVVE